MPITPQYSWSESSDAITILVGIASANAQKLDVEVSDVTFKINCQPYLLNLDLKEAVDFQRVSATVSDSGIEFVIPKSRPSTWGELSPSGLSKKKLFDRRRESLQRKSDFEAAERARRKQTKGDVKQHALHTQWAVEHQYKEMMQQLQQQDRQEAAEEINAWAGCGTASSSSESEGSSSAASFSSSSSAKHISWSEQLTKERAFDKNGAPTTNKKKLSDPVNKSAAAPASILKNHAGSTSQSSGEAPKAAPKAMPPKKVAAFTSGGVTIEEMSDDEEEERKKQQQPPKPSKTLPNTPSLSEPVPSSSYLSQEQMLKQLQDKLQKQAERVIPPAPTEPIVITSSKEKDIFSDADFGEDGEYHHQSSSSTVAEVKEEDSIPEPEPEEPVAPAVKPIRQNAKVEIQFTNINRTGPARNTRFAEAEAKAKATAAPKVRADAQEVGENHPVFLKDKGDSLFRAGDFHGALGAYSAALELEASLVSCLSNRAACYLKLVDAQRDFAQHRSWLQHCADDCSSALNILRKQHDDAEADAKASPNPVSMEDVLQPFEAPAARAQRAKLLLRRSLARHGLGQLEAAIHDMREACTQTPDDAKLAADSRQLEALFRDLQADKHASAKKQGDALYQQRQLDAAIDHYRRALSIHPSFVVCLANRAAALLALHRFTLCVRDCTLALSHLDHEPSINEDERRRLRVRLLSRRGAALVGDNQLVSAKRDYEAAVALNPHDLGLIQDLQRINQSLRQPTPDAFTSSSSSPSSTSVESSTTTSSALQNASTLSPQASSPSPSDSSVSLSTSPSLASKTLSKPLTAQQLFTAGRFAEALALFDQAVRSAAPWEPLPLLNRAAAHLALGDCSACTADCNRVLELVSALSANRLDEIESVALMRRAAAAAWMGEPQLGCEDLQQVMQTPRLAQTLSNEQLAHVRADLVTMAQAAAVAH